MSGKEFIDSYLCLSDSLYRVARYLLESDADASDAVQDLYTKLWCMKDSLDSVHNPRAYCITMIRNMCIDRLRKCPSGKEEELSEEVCGAEESTSALETKETLDRVFEAMNRLSPAQRMVLQMRVMEDMSYDEMQKQTGMNKLTLRVLLSQARSKIKNSI